MYLKSIIMMVVALGWCCNYSRARAMDNDTYWQQRQLLLEQDYSTRLGGGLVLSPDEEAVNKLVTEALQQVLQQGIEDPSSFAPAINFMLAKNSIEQTELFQIIRDMPKGAVLHGHDSALASVEYVVSTLTYWADLYMCYLDGVLVFRFSSSYPLQLCPDGWHLVQEERLAAESPAVFDAWLLQQMTLVTDDPDGMYPDLNTAWTRFIQYFTSMSGIFEHRPAFQAYLSQALSEFLADGVSYLEFRGTLPLLYELDGRVLDSLQTMQVYKDTIDAFTLANQNFYGTRFIYGPSRSVSGAEVMTYVSLAATLREQFPDLVAGFDLVGQEDLGPPLKAFVTPLLLVAQQNVTIPVFFHAGETDWYGQESDENILDALLLNSTRLGHGYALSKHPSLMELARNGGVPVEVCPVSNQVLKLVDDLRNHPAVSLAATSFPLVVSSDDPAAWGALPLSHDFFEAFVAFGGGKADLRFLKQLAINSIEYSSLDDDPKQELLALWQVSWDAFITNTKERSGRSHPANTLLSRGEEELLSNDVVVITSN